MARSNNETLRDRLRIFVVRGVARREPSEDLEGRRIEVEAREVELVGSHRVQEDRRVDLCEARLVEVVERLREPLVVERVALEAPPERQREVVRPEALVNAVERVRAVEEASDQRLDALARRHPVPGVGRAELVDRLADLKPLQRLDDDGEVIDASARHLVRIDLHGVLLLPRATEQWSSSSTALPERVTRASRLALVRGARSSLHRALRGVKCPSSTSRIAPLDVVLAAEARSLPLGIRDALPDLVVVIWQYIINAPTRSSIAGMSAVTLRLQVLNHASESSRFTRTSARLLLFSGAAEA